MYWALLVWVCCWTDVHAETAVSGSAAGARVVSAAARDSGRSDALVVLARAHTQRARASGDGQYYRRALGAEFPLAKAREPIVRTSRAGRVRQPVNTRSPEAQGYCDQGLAGEGDRCESGG